MSIKLCGPDVRYDDVQDPDECWADTAYCDEDGEGFLAGFLLVPWSPEEGATCPDGSDAKGGVLAIGAETLVHVASQNDIPCWLSMTFKGELLIEMHFEDFVAADQDPSLFAIPDYCPDPVESDPDESSSDESSSADDDDDEHDEMMVAQPAQVKAALRGSLAALNKAGNSAGADLPELSDYLHVTYEASYIDREFAGETMEKTSDGLSLKVGSTLVNCLVDLEWYDIDSDDCSVTDASCDGSETLHGSIKLAAEQGLIDTYETSTCLGKPADVFGFGDEFGFMYSWVWFHKDTGVLCKAGVGDQYSLLALQIITSHDESPMDISTWDKPADCPDSE